MRRFADARAAVSARAQSLYYPHMHYILDRFHAPGHVDQWCKDNVCPATEEHQRIADGVNTLR
eukprot:12416904-Karenia_brevis.AAC.1